MPSGMVNHFEYHAVGGKSGAGVTFGCDAVNMGRSLKYHLCAAGARQRRTIFFRVSGMHAQMPYLVSESGSLVFGRQQLFDLVQVPLGDGYNRRPSPAQAYAE